MLVITGAAGFIGSNLLAYWDGSTSEPIVACDIIDSNYKRANVAKRGAVNWITPSEALPFLKAHCNAIDAVIHMGAETSTTATNRAVTYRVNVELSMALWKWCVKQSVPFIYASSASVYGDGSQGFEDDLSLRSLETLKPLNLYGESKLAFDLFVGREVARGGPTPPQWAGLRLFNVYGPNEVHKGAQASVVSQMYPMAAIGAPYNLFRSHKSGIGDGEQKRDFLFVDDCANVIDWLIKTSSVSGIFNVGTGQARTFLDLARAVYAAAGHTPNILWIDTPGDIRGHYQYFTEANITRLRNAGFSRTFTSLEEGVTITIGNYLNQADPYR